MEATIESKKGGHIVYESALHTFLKLSPKYASIASTALISTAMIGGLIAQKIIDVEQLKRARISDVDIIKFLKSEIDTRKMTVESISAIEQYIAKNEQNIGRHKANALVYANRNGLKSVTISTSTLLEKSIMAKTDEYLAFILY